ncbi:probable E3 ubiquitin-protein ligase HERC3 isoform X2 [Narcine bancroftii]|uniref:probable E3 ubiquitin-protein ligase HERC3 isoform X2 n=1 Tax=Narcine bancroftii TaxID=1343680 RepID=UPI003831AFBE
MYWWQPGLQPELFPKFRGEQMRHVTCGDGFTVLVLESGKVWQKVDAKKTRYGQFPRFKKQKILFADCGTSHILFLSQNGNVFHSEVKSETSAGTISIMNPQLFESLCGNNIIQVACGNNHSLALSKDGQVFAWGQNTFGQLGLGTRNTISCSPQTLESFSGVPVAQVVAGGEHSLALTLSGAVFAWGRNNHGQLGLKDTVDALIPKYVQLLECKSIIYISCGEEHTAVLTKDGFVLTFGAGAYGQLGHNSRNDEIKPRFVGGLFGRKVSQISCGSYHTLALVPSSGTIYSFGCRERGQLRNDQTEHSVPLPIHLMATPSNDGLENGCPTKQNVRRIFAGANLSFADCHVEKNLISSRDQSLLIPLNRILTVENLLEKKIKYRVILQAFSSSQILNASFLDLRKDNHFKTSRMLSGLDMSSLFKNVEKLTTDKVTNVILTKLIPSLPRSPACVEALRVYLLLPELIAVLIEPMKSKMMESLSRAILSLEESYFEVLECWWRTMPLKAFERLVKIYHEGSVTLLQLAFRRNTPNISEFQNSLKILQTLNKVNATRDQKTEWSFNIPVMKIFRDCSWILNQLIPYSCIFDLDAKLDFLNLDSLYFTHNHIVATLTNVSRTAVLQDIINWYRSYNYCLHFTALQIIFKNETCYGHGVTQEFFTLFSQELQNDKRMFELNDESNLLWFTSNETEMDNVFCLVGMLCGIALSNGFVCNLHFPLALYKKLLHMQPTLEDLKQLFPEEGKSLQNVLDYEYDDIEDYYCLDFTVTKETKDGKRVTHELIPDGAKINVQKYNRKQFVDAYVDYKLNTSVERQFRAFAQGFRRAFPNPIVDLFLPEELMAVIHGNTDYEWELLKQNAAYRDYNENDDVITSFWETFESLQEEKKKKFIAFLSGSERIPVGGIGRLKINIFKPYTIEPDLSYPRAYTCSMSLELPNYSRREILREKLLHAIEQSEFNAMPP